MDKNVKRYKMGDQNPQRTGVDYSRLDPGMRRLYEHVENIREQGRSVMERMDAVGVKMRKRIAENEELIRRLKTQKP